jgi:hypothetical protein
MPLAEAIIGRLACPVCFQIDRKCMPKWRISEYDTQGYKTLRSLQVRAGLFRCLSMPRLRKPNEAHCILMYLSGSRVHKRSKHCRP